MFELGILYVNREPSLRHTLVFFWEISETSKHSFHRIFSSTNTGSRIKFSWIFLLSSSMYDSKIDGWAGIQFKRCWHLRCGTSSNLGWKGKLNYSTYTSCTDTGSCLGRGRRGAVNTSAADAYWQAPVRVQ